MILPLYIEYLDKIYLRSKDFSYKKFSIHSLQIFCIEYFFYHALFNMEFIKIFLIYQIFKK